MYIMKIIISSLAFLPLFSAFSVRPHFSVYNNEFKLLHTSSPITTTATNKATKCQMAIEAMSVESMSNNHEEEGQLMADSIIRWLDDEWMLLECHRKIATRAKETYVKSREAGDTDIMSIMMAISSDLDENWSNKELVDGPESFVNAWDIGNYIADYLTQRAGIEGCACSYKIM